MRCMHEATKDQSATKTLACSGRPETTPYSACWFDGVRRISEIRVSTGARRSHGALEGRHSEFAGECGRFEVSRHLNRAV